MPVQAHIPQISEADVKAITKNPVIADKDDLAYANPSAEMQEAFVGQSFEATYLEAMEFLNGMLRVVAAERTPERILDFGCGWGRMLRLLRREPSLKETELHGSDIDDTALDVDRRTIPGVWLTKIKKEPGTIYRDGSFDVVYAYSVLSHLSERRHVAWASEFHRILKPGGYVCVTTQGPSFFETCRQLREGVLPRTNEWHNFLARSFADPNTLERYRAGEFMYYGRDQKGADVDYGNAAVPRQYFEQEWAELGFRLVEWDETGVQMRATLQK
jgi:SAM-dependent methyltransferase